MGKRNVATKVAPTSRLGHLVLSQTQLGLALGFGAVGLIVAFGIGFIVGMWYQASDQIAPLEAGLTPSSEPRQQDRPMTFYSTLSAPEESASPPPPPQTVAAPRPAVAPPVTPQPQPLLNQEVVTGGRYSVQVGSFRAPEQAEQLQRRLIGKGYAARIQSSTVPGRGVWYRVRIGGFGDRGAADRAAQRLVAQEHLSIMIMNEAQ